MTANAIMTHEQIRDVYFGDPDRAPRAVTIVSQSRSTGPARRNLKRLLRHHSEEEIGTQETWDRDAFDYLVAYFSMMEVACTAGYLPSSLGDPVRRTALRYLKNPAILRYYESNYPLLLPQLFRIRLESNGRRAVPSAPRAFASQFPLFFELTRTRESDGPIETFLWFLDGGDRNGVDISDTLNAISSPKRFFAALLRSDSQADDLDLSIRGFVDFVDFSLAFESLLSSMQEDSSRPSFLQSAMWHYHGHWFDHMRDEFGGFLRDALAQVASWKSRGQKRSRGETGRGHSRKHPRTEEAFGRLLSGRYRWPLAEMIVELRR